mmetsp:Transcript_46383/g.105202  ORF Transcript_46383/g.105202 Transcript_46383/m.105202 type:complete len:308 (-) Transcript_46383:1275-2198(-)
MHFFTEGALPWFARNPGNCTAAVANLLPTPQGHNLLHNRNLLGLLPLLLSLLLTLPGLLFRRLLRRLRRGAHHLQHQIRGRILLLAGLRRQKLITNLENESHHTHRRHHPSDQISTGCGDQLGGRAVAVRRTIDLNVGLTAGAGHSWRVANADLLPSPTYPAARMLLPHRPLLGLVQHGIRLVRPQGLQRPRYRRLQLLLARLRVPQLPLVLLPLRPSPPLLPRRPLVLAQVQGPVHAELGCVTVHMQALQRGVATEPFVELLAVGQGQVVVGEGDVDQVGVLLEHLLQAPAKLRPLAGGGVAHQGS